MRIDDELEDFLRTRTPELRRMALLLADDPGRARQLTESVLVGVARQWRDLRDEGRPSSRTWTQLAERLLSLPEPASTPGGAEADPVAEAWRRLPRPARLAWVAEYDDPPGLRDALPSLSGMPSAPLPELLASARDRLVHAIDEVHLREGRPRSTEWEADQTIRHLLDDLSAAAAHWGDPVEQVRLRLRGRRRRGLVATAAVVAVVVAGGGALAATRGTPTPGPTGTPQPTFSLPTSSEDHSAWAGWPARTAPGEDVGRDIVAGVIRRYRGSMRILWAADIEGRRQVLLVPRLVRGADHPEFTFLTGPAGTDVADLDESMRWTNPDAPLITLYDRTDPGTVRLIVLAPPNLPSAEVSRTVQVDADFTIERMWERLPLDRGGAVLTLGAGRWMSLQVRAGPITAAPSMTDPDTWSLGRFDCAGCAWDEARDRMVAGLRAEMAEDTGLGVDQVRVQTRIDAPLPATAVPFWDKTPVAARALVLRWTLPSGAVLDSVMIGGQMAEPALIQWAPWLDATPVQPADLDGPTTLPSFHSPDGSTRVIVLVPQGSPATYVTASTGDTVRTRADLSEGVAILDNTPDVGVRVTLHDKDGNPLASQNVGGGSLWQGPWDLFKYVN